MIKRLGYSFFKTSYNGTLNLLKKNHSIQNYQLSLFINQQKIIQN